MAELKRITAQRASVRGKVTRSYNKIGEYVNYDGRKAVSERAHLEQCRDLLKSLNSQYDSLKFKDDEATTEYQDEVDLCFDYELKLRECLLHLDKVDKASMIKRPDDAPTLLKQPTAPLPTFNYEKGDDLEKFLKEFELTTSRFSYPDRDLLLLLIQQVSGSAVNLLKSLEIDNQTYQEAKSLLTEAFANKTTKKFGVIDKLVKLKLGYGDDPYVFRSELNSIKSLVISLGLEIDDILQYFIWNNINPKFRSALTFASGEMYPTFDQILKSFFSANERYQQMNKGKDFGKKDVGNNKGRFTNFGVGVETMTCFLCDSKEHKFLACTKFDTSIAKINQLKELRRCVKCGSKMHDATKCNFRFKSRCKCGGWHFWHLCPKQDKNRKPPQPEKVDAQVKVTNCKSNKSGSILPTLTAVIDKCKFRVLVDRASECSFISENALQRINFKVVQPKVNLTIKGFNAPQRYESKLIEVKGKLGNCKVVHTMQFLVIPKIGMNLELKGLGNIINAFKEKDYNLADSYFNSKSTHINNLDIVLGAEHAVLVSGEDKPFGLRSLFIQSKVGVLLLGNVKDLLIDIPKLPGTKTTSCNVVNVKPGNDSTSVDMSVYAFCINQKRSRFPDFDSAPVLDSVPGGNKEVSVPSDLSAVTNSQLEYQYRQYIAHESLETDQSDEINTQLVNYTLGNIKRTSDGRIQVPLLWNRKVSHKLARNYGLSKTIFQSNVKKLSNNGQMEQVDDVIKEQVEAGIIERIDCPSQYFQENPNYSFLPHMPIFKPNKETTKCRVVFLSNLCDKYKDNISHNQAMYSGPSLNHKLSSALLSLRFDKYLLTYDLKKAFNQLALSEADQAKLLFFWCDNVKKANFSPVIYRNCRLSFGLRCSPFLLMIAMYFILLLDTDEDDDNIKQLKKHMYSLLYMDNGAVTSNDEGYLKWTCSVIGSIFSPYHFEVQQILTNLTDDVNSDQPDEVDLLGLKWNRSSDTLCTRRIELNPQANTKRDILSSIASQFDLFNFNLPLFNRSRLFMQSLQSTRGLDWDEKLSNELLVEWRNIVKQINSFSPLHVPRCIGARTDSYNILCFTDASKMFYGNVVYLHNLNNNKIQLVGSQNRAISKNLKNKSIPSLELQAMTLGAENMLNMYTDLAGENCINPITINDLYLFTDSVCCIHWLKSAVTNLDKLNKLTTFVRNRIHQIEELCNVHTISFKFIAGEANPADQVTRCVSPKTLAKSNFLTGPPLQKLMDGDPDLQVVVPNPLYSEVNSVEVCHKTHSPPTEFIKIESFSSLSRLVRVVSVIIKGIQSWKNRALGSSDTVINLYSKAFNCLILQEQGSKFADVVSYFHNSKPKLMEIPDLINRYNVYMDEQGMLRVKAKFKVWEHDGRNNFPILLSPDSHLTTLIIHDYHFKTCHSGYYAVLSELRKDFFITKQYSTVKKALKDCQVCKRFNARPIKLNQNDYRMNRIAPKNIPFSEVFVDHLGPIYVLKNSVKCKIWLLCITCMWTRGVNLVISHDLTTKEFLRNFQLHCYQYGLPQTFVSDLGSQLTAGTKIIHEFLADPELISYFDYHGVKACEFAQYFKGCSKLGSLVEVIVKATKRLLYGAIKNRTVDILDFEVIIELVINLLNKRPIAFKKELRSPNDGSVPEPITPELLIRGYETISVNFIPNCTSSEREDPTWIPNNSNIEGRYKVLTDTLTRVRELYQSEFLQQLMNQAIDRDNRYKPVLHKPLKKGDIVLLKEENCKPNHFPLGMVEEVVLNDLQEVTGAIVRKGTTRERVKRHSSTIIPMINVKEESCEAAPSSPLNDVCYKKNSRKAASVAKCKIKNLNQLQLV